MEKQKKIVNIPIDSCTKCEHFTTKKLPAADSWERPEEWICGKDKSVIIDGYHDIWDKDPGIPDNCPQS